MERGGLLLDVVINWPSTIVRRAEQIILIDDRTLARRVSLDMVPQQDLPFLPLGLLAKGPLEGFDARNGHGSAIHIQSRLDNERLVSDMLIEGAARTLGREPQQPVKEILTEVASSSPKRAWDAIETLETLRYGSTVAYRDSQELLDNDAYWTLLSQLADNFILIAEVSASAGERQLVKISYVSTRGEIVRHVARRFLAAEVSFELPGAMDARSYHVEVTAPSGLAISRAEMRVVPGALAKPPDRVVRTTWASRVHLYSRRRDSELGSAVTGDMGLLDVRFELEAQGLLRQGMLAAASVVAVLWFVNLRQDWIRVSEPDAVGALLLTLPGSLSLFVARPGQHELSRRLFWAIRFGLHVLGVASYIVTALLVLVPHDGYTPYPWWLTEQVLPWVACGASAIVAIATVGVIARWARFSECMRHEES